MKQLLWCIMLAALGIFGALTQLDREARYQSELTDLVPREIRYFAQFHQAEAALTREDSAAALAEARALVARRPVPAEHLRMLAQAQLLSGDNAAGTPTLQLAATRGWRDIPTQFAMLSIAQAASDDVQMVQRYFALWVQADSRAQLQPWAKTVFASSKAREEAVRLLDVKGRWQSAFLSDGLRDLPEKHARQIACALEPGLIEYPAGVGRGQPCQATPPPSNQP